MLQEISSEYYPVWNLKFRSKILDFLKKENIVSNNFFELEQYEKFSEIKKIKYSVDNKE